MTSTAPGSVSCSPDRLFVSWSIYEIPHRIRCIAPHDYRPELPDADRQALYELEQIQKQAGAEGFSAARDRFAANRHLIEWKINTALIDEPARTNAFTHVNAFYDALDSIPD